MRSLCAKIKLFRDWHTSCKWVIADVTFQEYVRLMKQKFEDAEAEEMDVEVITEAGEEQEQYN